MDLKSILQDRRVLIGLLVVLLMALVITIIMCRAKAGRAQESFVDVRKIADSRSRKMAEDMRFI